jgi:hypothetical protein
MTAVRKPFRRQRLNKKDMDAYQRYMVESKRVIEEENAPKPIKKAPPRGP